ncbi:MAG: hypothetical protein ACLFVJ_22775, partial [Persicimonas sp.]
MNEAKSHHRSQMSHSGARVAVFVTAILAVLVVIVGTGCGGEGRACSSNSDCDDGYRCASSGGVLFGESICVATRDLPAGDDDAGHLDAGD